MTCQKDAQTCRECVELGQAWGFNGVCTTCQNVSPCFHTKKQCSEYDALHEARGVCGKQQSCDKCHEANSNCRWAAGTCAVSQNVFNSARGCPLSKTPPVVTPATTSSMCVGCIEGGGIWQAGKCTGCEDDTIGFCYETKESCPLWDLRAVAVELCPQQNSCSECLYAHPYCLWMYSTESCVGSVGQKLRDTIDHTDACPLPRTTQSTITQRTTTQRTATQRTTTERTATQRTTTSKSPTPGACADGCGCC